MEVITTQLESFLSRTRDLIASLDHLRMEDFKTKFARAANELALMKSKHEDLDRSMASNFNVFTLLGVQRKEVATHSAVIGDLLDPSGRHGQGALFLRKFLRMPCLAIPDSVTEFASWRVQREKPTFAGNLDIFVSSSGPFQQCFIIENKIDAEDQHGQLARYYHWLLTRRSFYDIGSSRLIYLTVDGRAPSNHALSFYAHSENRVDAQVFKMSYRREVRLWLVACLAEVTAPKIKMYLDQYLEVLEKL